MHDAHIHIHDEKLVQILVKNQIPVIANAQNQSQYKFLSSFQNLLLIPSNVNQSNTPVKRQRFLEKIYFNLKKLHFNQKTTF